MEVTPYPRPGEPNPKVRLGIVRIGGGAPRWVDLAPYAAAEPLVVDVAWTPKGEVAYQVQDREQTWLDLNLADGAGRSRKCCGRRRGRGSSPTAAPAG